jgi:poly(3-hydroxybutyrate) depolymerase
MSIAAVALACLGLAGCGNSAGQATNPSAAPPRTATSGPGIATTTGPVTSISTSTTTVVMSCSAASGYQSLPNGRTMLVRAPAVSNLRPAVIMLHGYTATPTGEEAVSGWTTFMARTNALVAYPQGSPTPSGGYGWTTGAAHDATTGTNDVADIVDVVNYLVSQDCVDPNQIMIAGESNGSGLGLLLGCSGQLPTVHLFVLAIPAVDSGVLANCLAYKPTPFPLLVIASALDTTVPYNGAPSAPGVPAFSAPLTWFMQIATEVDGCTGQIQSASVPDGIHYWYESCATPANFYVAADGHHTWPGGPTGAGGLSPGAFPASTIAWCASTLMSVPQPVSCPPLASTYGFSGPDQAL